MKIAQIAPLLESVPPRLYGGTERVVSYLTEELAHRGHEVTLFASGDSLTSASLVPCSPQALRLSAKSRDPVPHTLLLLEKVKRRIAQFDVLHFHADLLHLPIFRPFASRTLTTLHGRLDLPGLRAVYSEYADMPLISISNSQRLPVPRAHWLATVMHGIPASLMRYTAEPRGDYLAFLGRISPEKGPETAIAIAKAVGIRIRIAAKVDPADKNYFEYNVQPLLDHPLIEWTGEIGENRKSEFLGNARALLFPIDWPEPFGLVMIEAMACGTPVIAFRRGSVPEIIEDGVNGFVVETAAGAIEAIRRLDALDRARVRACFERRFTAARMADDYIRVYEALAPVPRLQRHHIGEERPRGQEGIRRLNA